MRQKAEELLPLCHIFPDHQMARELGKISEILDQNPRISEIVLQDLCDNSNPQKGAGARHESDVGGEDQRTSGIGTRLSDSYNNCQTGGSSCLKTLPPKSNWNNGASS